MPDTSNEQKRNFSAEILKIHVLHRLPFVVLSPPLFFFQAETTNTSLLQVQLECSLHNKVCQQLKIFFEFFLFFPSLQSQSCYVESDDVLRLQMSIIVTMGNSSKEFEENTQDLLDHLSIIYVATDKSETSENPNWEGSLSLDRSTWDVDSELSNKLYERWKKFKNGDVCSYFDDFFLYESPRRSVLGTTRFAHSKRSRESEPFASFLPRLIPQPGVMLNFSATALRSSVVKYFVVKNPSSLPVSLQLLPISLYPRPEAAVRLLHKWFGTDTQMINFTTGEFQLTKACPYQGVHAEESGFGVLHLHLQPLEMKRVGVVFTPADYGKVTSLILIRNNLTVIDMVGVEGFGARELLKVGGRLPGAGGSLRFKVPESTLMDCRRRESESVVPVCGLCYTYLLHPPAVGVLTVFLVAVLDLHRSTPPPNWSLFSVIEAQGVCVVASELKDSKQILSITKNFKVENIGPLPITVTSLKINGYNCQGYGFEVLDCHQFSLDPSTSRDISIVFTPDFTSSWVIRELTLVTAADLEFRFTLNVTLPHHLLPLCADVVPGPSWEESFWRLTVFFVG
ncbi:Transmembrane protein 131-like [Camelus dromedarius]|nr:Transmembrane protein 131-like [Camelus dromedarius]